METLKISTRSGDSLILPIFDQVPIAAPALTWIGFSGNTYALFDTLATWSEANAYAQSLGGYLAQVNFGSEENAEIFQNLSRVWVTGPSYALDGGYAGYVWLGGSDTAVEDVWRWSADQTLISQHYSVQALWGAGAGKTEPDNFNVSGIPGYGGDISGQDYLALAMESWPYQATFTQQIGSAGQWNDLTGNNKL